MDMNGGSYSLKGLTIYLKEETLSKIKQFIHYSNLNHIYKHKNIKDNEVEEFIKGAIIREIERVEQYHLIKDQIFNPNKKFQNKFETLRKEKGYTQTYLAEVTGMNQVTLSNIMNNKKQFRSDNFFKLWVAFQCPPIEECIEFVDE
jgi:predicted transcriptional regulator